MGDMADLQQQVDEKWAADELPHRRLVISLPAGSRWDPSWLSGGVGGSAIPGDELLLEDLSLGGVERCGWEVLGQLRDNMKCH
jgi:hypothetical protein